MVWRTDRGLMEPTAAAVLWLWAGFADADRGEAREEAPNDADPGPVARRLAASAGDVLFDPTEFALLGGWAYLTGTVSRSTH
jgi:hypothetical protein